MTLGQYIERTLQYEYREEQGEDASLLGFLHFVKGRLYRLGWSTVGVSLSGYETPDGGWSVHIGEDAEPLESLLLGLVPLSVIRGRRHS